MLQSEKLEIRGRSPAITARLQFEGDLLIVVQTFQPGALDGRDVDEYVFAAIIGRGT